MEKNVLELFSVSTAEWFQETFGEPTKVQKEAWPAIAAGNHVLVSAPTGTGDVYKRQQEREPAWQIWMSQ